MDARLNDIRVMEEKIEDRRVKLEQLYSFLDHISSSLNYAIGSALFGLLLQIVAVTGLDLKATGLYLTWELIMPFYGASAVMLALHMWLGWNRALVWQNVRRQHHKLVSYIGLLRLLKEQAIELCEKSQQTSGENTIGLQAGDDLCASSATTQE